MLEADPIFDAARATAAPNRQVPGAVMWQGRRKEKPVKLAIVISTFVWFVIAMCVIGAVKGGF